MEKDLITEPNTCQYCTHWFQCGLCTHEPDLFMETPEHWPETTNIDTCKGYVELSDLWEYCYI